MRWLLVALVLAATVAAADGIGRWELVGWRASVAVRPNAFDNGACSASGFPFSCCTGNGSGTCGYSTCQANVNTSVAAQARYVMVSAEMSVPMTETVNASQTFTLVPHRSNSTAAPTSVYDDNIASANTCWYPSATYRGQDTDDNLASYITAVRSAASPGTTTVILFVRSDIIQFPAAQIAGLDCGWFVDATTDWDTDWIAAVEADTSTDCGAGSDCRWSDSYSGSSSSYRDKDTDCRDGTVGSQDCRLRASIDRICGSADAWKTKVFYMTRGASGQQYFYPDAALMRLDDPDYRAWWISHMKRRLAATGADMIELNEKFSQYLVDAECTAAGDPYPCCTAANEGDGCSSYMFDMFSDLSAWNAANNSNYTSDPHDAPESYTYNAYVNGWADLAAEASAAGLKFAYRDGPYAWFAEGTGFDDPDTVENENDVIKQAAYSASLVILDKQGRSDAEYATAVADLEAHGVTVYQVDSIKGLQYPRGD